ncbi:MAG: prepilin peptidase, partial [Pirellulales bacterium]
MSASALGWFTAMWLTALGAVVGSFLNVVVYRLPQGESLVHPPSRCPKCGHPIRWYDNVPIVGWLILRGRCRDCRAAISARYPIVEAITALMFLVPAVLECALRGANLPQRAVEVGAGIMLSGRSGQMLYGVFLYHELLLCTLLAAALIQWDGHRVPLRLFWPVSAFGAALPVIWPQLHPVAATPITQGPVAGLADAAAGLAGGWLIGWLAARLEHPGRRHGLTWALAAVGLILGWQAVVVVGSLTALWTAGRRLAERRRPQKRQRQPHARVVVVLQRQVAAVAQAECQHDRLVPLSQLFEGHVAADADARA